MAEMDNAVAELCHNVISTIAEFIRERTDLPDHVSVSCSLNDVDVTFDIYLTKREHATTQG